MLTSVVPVNERVAFLDFFLTLQMITIIDSIIITVTITATTAIIIILEVVAVDSDVVVVVGVESLVRKLPTL